MAVYKDKNRGTWYASILYVDWTGKRCRKLKRGFATKKEAQEWEMHFKLQKASSLDMTFGDFYKIYEQDVKPKVRYNTWCSKQHIIETKLLPYFKDLVMRDITPRDIIQWQNSMREASKKNGGEYAGTYLKTVQAQLSSIFNHAVRFYQLPNNPVRIAGALGQYDSDEMLFWTKEEYIGNRVGHESEKITYRYAHLFPSVQGEMAEALDDEWKEGFNVGKEEG